MLSGKFSMGHPGGHLASPNLKIADRRICLALICLFRHAHKFRAGVKMGLMPLAFNVRKQTGLGVNKKNICTAF